MNVRMGSSPTFRGEKKQIVETTTQFPCSSKVSVLGNIRILHVTDLSEGSSRRKAFKISATACGLQARNKCFLLMLFEKHLKSN